MSPSLRPFACLSENEVFLCTCYIFSPSSLRDAFELWEAEVANLPSIGKTLVSTVAIFKFLNSHEIDHENNEKKLFFFVKICELNGDHQWNYV